MMSNIFFKLNYPLKQINVGNLFNKSPKIYNFYLLSSI